MTQPILLRRKALLMGNGPSIMDNKLGNAIDSFDGTVVRLNNFMIAGYEANVGTRCDLWITARSWEWGKDKFLRAHFQHRRVVVPRHIPREGVGLRCTGVIAAIWLLELGCEVVLYGFDHHRTDRPHHYYSPELEKNPVHACDRKEILALL